MLQDYGCAMTSRSHCGKLRKVWKSARWELRADKVNKACDHLVRLPGLQSLEHVTGGWVAEVRGDEV